MKNVKIGETYKLKVGANLVDVKIDRSIAGGWEATSIKSGKTITIKDAKRLKASKTTKTKTVVVKKPISKRVKAKTASTTKDKTKPKNESNQGMSLLDAAAHLLSLGTGDPMSCRDIVEIATKRDLWKPGKGLTPANTLYSSILREINNKGKESRFVKAERGKFALAK